MAIRRLDLIITSNATAALRGFASLEGAAKAMENRFGKAGRAMFNIGVIGAAGAVAFTAKSVKAFIDFDEQMTKSTAILDNVSGPVRKRLEDAAKAIAKTTTFSATEAAEAFYGLFSAGLSAEQTISAIPVVAQFAQAALMDMGQATDYLVNAQSSLGLSMDDPIANMREMQRVADVLTETNNLATGTVEEFAEALTHKAGGALKTVGKDIEEGAAALAYLAEQGVRGSRAGESLAIFIRDVSRAAGNASFVDDFRKFGVEVFNAEGNLKNLADVVGEFEQALGPMSDKERAVTLEQMGLTRSVGDVIRQMMGGSGAIREYEVALRNAGGATQSVADKQMESLRSKIDIIKNRLNVLMIDFGEPVAIWLVEVFFPWFETKFIPALRDTALLVREDLRPAFELAAKALDNPAVVKFLVFMGGFLTVMIAASKVAKIFAIAVGAGANIIKIFMVVLRPLIGLVKLGATIFSELRFAMFAIRYAIVTQVMPALTALATMIGISVGWLILIIIAIVAVGVAIYVWRDEIWGAIKAVGRFFVRLWDDIYGGFVMPIVRFFTGPFIDFWKAVWQAVEGPIKVFLRVIQVFGSIMLAILLAPFIIVAGVIYAVVKAIVTWLAKHWWEIALIISTVWGYIVDGTKWVWHTVIVPLISLAWNIIYTMVWRRIMLVLTVIRMVWNLIRFTTYVTWQIITGIILAAWHFIRDRIATPLARYWSAYVVPALTVFWQSTVMIWNLIKGAFQAAWHWLRDTVIKPFMAYWEVSVVPKLIAFRDSAARIWTQIKDTAAAVWDSIVAAIKTPVNAIIKVINALIDGINAVIGLINEIPGVDIPRIPRIPLIGSSRGGGQGSSSPQLTGGANEMGTYDLAKRGPFKTHGPRAIVGEGDPRFPEYVIPTDPRFRGRANMLFSGLASELGAGYQFGGIIDGVTDAVGGAIDAAGGLLGDLARGALKTAFSPFNEAAKSGLNRLPNVFKMRDVAQGFRELVWKIVAGADAGFPEQSRAMAGASGAGLGGNTAANRRLGQQLNAARGWGSHWSALDSLVMSESGWNNNAQNPTSTAYGIGQFLNSTWAGVGYSKTSDPRIQIMAMLDYIRQRYVDPSRAWTFKKSHNWYSGGGELPSFAAGLYRVPTNDFPASLHKDEMVLKASDANAVRDGGPGSGNTMIRIENFNINIDGAGSLEDARRKARAAGKAFLDVLEERRVLTDARIS